MMMKKPALGLLSAAILSTALLVGCSGGEAKAATETAQPAAVAEVNAAVADSVAQATLPENLVWLTNDTDPVFANVDAPKGGKITFATDSFPLTIRGQGPDSNGAFAGYVRSTWAYLVVMHPNTRNYFPLLATEWAFGDDDKTVYFKLNPKATWSDGEPLTADDFVFTREYMTSPFIDDSWYTQFYGEEIAEVSKIDDHTIKIVSASAKAADELLYHVNSVTVVPEHAIRPVLKDGFVTDQNWTIFPTLMPYQFSKIDMGKTITMERNKNWWGSDLKYFKGRYNVDTIEVVVIRDPDIQRQALNKGEIDAMTMVLPNQWHSFDDSYSAWANGYVQKTWAITDAPQGLSGVWVNETDPLLSNRDIRVGLAHSLNIQKMIDVALHGDYNRLVTVGSGYGAYTNNDVARYDFDPEAARAAFAKAGYDKMGPNGFWMNADGQELTISLLYLSPNHTERVSVLAEEAKKAGLNLVLDLQAGATGFKAMLEKNHQTGFLSMGSSVFPDLYQYFHSSNAKEQTNNFTMTVDAELDKYLEAYRDGFDPAERAAANREAERLIMERASFLPTYSTGFDRTVHWRYVKLPADSAATALTDLDGLIGMDYSGAGFRFWIDQDEKARVLAAKAAGEKLDQVFRFDTTFKK